MLKLVIFPLSLTLASSRNVCHRLSFICSEHNWYWNSTMPLSVFENNGARGPQRACYNFSLGCYKLSIKWLVSEYWSQKSSVSKIIDCNDFCNPILYSVRVFLCSDLRFLELLFHNFFSAPSFHTDIFALPESILNHFVPDSYTARRMLIEHGSVLPADFKGK